MGGRSGTHGCRCSPAASFSRRNSTSTGDPFLLKCRATPVLAPERPHTPRGARSEWYVSTSAATANAAYTSGVRVLNTRPVLARNWSNRSRRMAAL